jgi:hypothetical protein
VEPGGRRLWDRVCEAAKTRSGLLFAATIALAVAPPIVSGVGRGRPWALITLAVIATVTVIVGRMKQSAETAEKRQLQDQLYQARVDSFALINGHLAPLMEELAAMLALRAVEDRRRALLTLERGVSETAATLALDRPARCSFFLSDDEGVLRVKVHSSGSRRPRLSFAPGTSAYKEMQQCARKGTHQFYEDLAADAPVELRRRPRTYETFAGVPVMVGPVWFGWLVVDAAAPGDFDEAFVIPILEVLANILGAAYCASGYVSVPADTLDLRGETIVTTVDENTDPPEKGHG